MKRRSFKRSLRRQLSRPKDKAVLSIRFIKEKLFGSIISQLVALAITLLTIIGTGAYNLVYNPYTTFVIKGVSDRRVITLHFHFQIFGCRQFCASTAHMNEVIFGGLKKLWSFRNDIYDAKCSFI